MNDILKCEEAYTACFSDVTFNNGIAVYTDEKLPDQYSHNFYGIHTDIQSEDILSLVNEKLAQLSGKGHLKLDFALGYTHEQVQHIKDNAAVKMEVTRLGCYVLDIEKVQGWHIRHDGIIVPYDAERLNDTTQFYLEFDGDTLGADFITRRTKRKGDVFEANHGIDNYLLYFNEDVIGTCELFIHDGVAKIEDFLILDRFQRQGWGTTMLNHLVNEALAKGVTTIYLIADEDDTAKDMYGKLGFTKIYETYELLWADWMA